MHLSFAESELPEFLAMLLNPFRELLWSSSLLGWQCVAPLTVHCNGQLWLKGLDFLPRSMTATRYFILSKRFFSWSKSN